MKGTKIKKGRKKISGEIMINKTFDIVDSKTGEIIEMPFIVVHKKVDEFPFVKVYPALTQKVIEDMQTNRIDGAIKLLFYIADQIIQNNMNTTEFYLHPEEAAKEIKTTSRTIRTWIKILMKEKYFLKHPDKKGKHWYVFNPYYLFRGNLKGHMRDELWKKALLKEKPLFQTEKKLIKGEKNDTTRNV